MSAWLLNLLISWEGLAIAFPIVALVFLYSADRMVMRAYQKRNPSLDGRLDGALLRPPGLGEMPLSQSDVDRIADAVSRKIAAQLGAKKRA